MICNTTFWICHQLLTEWTGWWAWRRWRRARPTEWSKRLPSLTLPTDPTILPPPPKLSPVQSPSRLDVTNLPSKLANLQPPPTRFGRILPFLGKKGYERFGQRIVLALLQLVFSEIRRWSVGGRWITWELGQFFHATFFPFALGIFNCCKWRSENVIEIYLFLSYHSSHPCVLC